ncbi:MAG: hypothetical protein HY393_00745 [Candidatus Diapherotrites archaeon]|nr:hypothetical protein [Candidatus Diapherotrites archaeon]
MKLLSPFLLGGLLIALLLAALVYAQTASEDNAFTIYGDYYALEAQEDTYQYDFVGKGEEGPFVPVGTYTKPFPAFIFIIPDTSIQYAFEMYSVKQMSDPLFIEAKVKIWRHDGAEWVLVGEPNPIVSFIPTPSSKPVTITPKLADQIIFTVKAVKNSNNPALQLQLFKVVNDEIVTKYAEEDVEEDAEEAQDDSAETDEPIINVTENEFDAPVSTPKGPSTTLLEALAKVDVAIADHFFSTQK